RRERPEPVLDLCEPGCGNGADDLDRRLVTGAGLVERHVSVGVDEDPRLTVLAVDPALGELARGLAARETTPGAVVDRVAARDRARQRPQDEAVVHVTARDEHGVAGLLPERARERRVAGRKGARRALAMDEDVAELG